MTDVKTSATFTNPIGDLYLKPEYTTVTAPATPLVIKVTPEWYMDRYFPSACDHCSNNPKNGGSGVCFCIMGNIPVTC